MDKNVLRFGKRVIFKSRYIQQYFHVDCAFEIFKKARVPTTVFGSLNELKGFSQISSPDKYYITRRFQNEIVSMEIAIPPEPPRMPPHQPSSKAHRSLKSYTSPHISVMFTNADQLTADKISELKSRIQREKPLLITICEIKAKNLNVKERTIQDYKIPNYSIHPLNLETSTGRGMAIYTHNSIDDSVVEIKPGAGFDEACLIEVKLRVGTSCFPVHFIEVLRPQLHQM